MLLDLALWPARVIGLFCFILDLVKSKFSGKVVVIFQHGKIQKGWSEAECSADFDRLGETCQRLMELPLREGGDGQGSVT